MEKIDVTNKLLKLLQENPNLPIRAKVDCNLCSGYDFAWYMGDIVDVEVLEYAIWGETLYLCRESLLDDWMNSNFYEFDENISDDELEEHAKIATDGLWKKAIFVSVEATEDDTE